MIEDGSELINKRLGNYTIKRLIRLTHMSAVYSGTELFTERPVAVKVLFPSSRPGSRDYNKYLMRFQREAYFIANLRHPYIIPILAYSEYQDLAYLVMPYYAHGTLGNLLHERGHLSLYETTRSIERIAPALDYAHAQNITHRDIKPGNFLLDENGCLILTDFGIALLTGNPNWTTLTTTNKVLGTPQYMAPEMLRGQKADPRADIYALGIVIYEMLHGKVPFTGNDFYEIMDKHFNNPLPSLHTLHPEIPVTVDDVLKKATAKERTNRFTSVSELATALSQAASPYSSSDAPTEVDFALPAPFFSPARSAIPPTIQAGQVAIPSISSQATRPSPKFFVWTLSITTLILLSLFFGVAYGPTILSSLRSSTNSTPVSFSTQTPLQAGRAAVQAYYDDWNNGHSQAAYTILNPDYRKDHSYQQLDYARVQYSCIAIGQVTETSPTEVQVNITINQIESVASGSGKATNLYTGYFSAQLIGGQWYIWPYLSLKSIYGSCIQP